MAEQLVKIKKIYPAFDKRDPIPSKNYGISPERELYAVVGEVGAMAFDIFTDRFRPHVAEELGEDDIICHYPMGGCVNYHFRQCPEDWKDYAKAQDCDLLGGQPCYCDGSALAGDDMLALFKRRGEEGVFQALTKRYHDAVEEHTFTEQEADNN